MFEVLMLAVSAQAATPPAAQPATTQAPPAELLEFLGDWSDQDAALLDEDPGQAGTAKRRSRLDETPDENNADAQTDR